MFTFHNYADTVFSNIFIFVIQCTLFIFSCFFVNSICYIFWLSIVIKRKVYLKITLWLISSINSCRWLNMIII